MFIQSPRLWTVQINFLNKFCGFLHFQLLFSVGFGVFPLHGFMFFVPFPTVKGIVAFCVWCWFFIVCFFSHEVKLDCGDTS